MPENTLRDHVHFALSMERAVRLSNCEVIGSMLSPLTEEQLMAVSVQVAKARGAYLVAAVNVGATGGSRPAASELKALREDFEEKRDAFASLMTAIERGYIDDPPHDSS